MLATSSQLALDFEIANLNHVRACAACCRPSSVPAILSAPR